MVLLSPESEVILDVVNPGPGPQNNLSPETNAAQFCGVGGASGANFRSTSLARAHARPRSTVNPEGVSAAQAH